MSEAEKAFTAEQIALADTLMKEEPRIEAALKNYLSLKMAERLTSSDAAAGAETQGGYKERKAGASTPGNAAADAAKIQGCARVVLRTLNNLELPVVTKWGSKHPQGESEDGLKYMARLGKYKVVQELWMRAKAQQQKPAKLLGRTALQYAMPEASELILADSAASAKSAGVAEAELHAFLSGFEATMELQVENPEAEGPSESELVWTTNQAALLRERQQKRNSEAAGRRERAVNQEQYMQDLRNAMAPANSTTASGPRIEEITE